jgi:transcription elongation GreA/GreB family factor
MVTTNDETALLPLRRNLRYWLTRRSNMKIVPPVTATQVVGFGVRIAIRRKGQTSNIDIVGEDEAQSSAGSIAWTAPLARALDGAQPVRSWSLKLAAVSNLSPCSQSRRGEANDPSGRCHPHPSRVPR